MALRGLPKASLEGPGRALWEAGRRAPEGELPLPLPPDSGPGERLGAAQASRKIEMSSVAPQTDGFYIAALAAQQ